MSLSPLEAMRAAMALDLPPHLSHTVLVLTTHWPYIWPSQRRLMAEMHVSHATLNRRLAELEQRGIIVRSQRDYATTLYFLKLRKQSRQRDTEEQSNGNDQDQIVDDLEGWG